MTTTEAVIVAAYRTAIGAFGGQLSNLPACDLGAAIVRALLDKTGVQAGDVDEVILGNVLQAGQGMNVARQISLKAGLPVEVPSMTANKVCGSGLKSIVLAAQAVTAGAGIVVAGGVENMDMAPYLIQKGRYGYRMGHAQLVDAMLKDGLWCAITDTHMGLTAENVAEKWGITREAQDKYAAMSQNRAETAITSHRFEDEIIPIEVPVKRDQRAIVSQDEHPRFGTSEAGLARLRPAFKKDGTVTAGNASGINDGAAAVLVMSQEKASQLGLEPLAKIRSYASAGVAPEFMGMGPVPATKKALERAGLELKDIDLIEANEAFAATNIAVGQELGLDLDRVNVNGGAIALGHPIGASGARILVTLLHEMKKRGSHRGLATMCIGGGMGIAVIVER